jgi:queuosine precursor transporter
MTESKEKMPLLPIITGVFVAILVLTPSASSKFIALGPLSIAGSTLFFPISYIFGDILTEVYGYERSRRVIWIGFACQVFAALMYALIQFWPAASFWHSETAYDIILGQAPRIVAGSLVAYFCGEFVNSFIVSKMKFIQGGRTGFALAARFVTSTIFGELIDSTLFMTIGFYGVLATNDLVTTILTIWILKTLYEIVALPVSMRIVAWVKRREGVDVIDRPETTNYTPFRV